MSVEVQNDGGVATEAEPIVETPDVPPEPVVYDDWSTGVENSQPANTPPKAPAPEIDHAPPSEDAPETADPPTTDEAAPEDADDLVDLPAFGQKIKVTDPKSREVLARLDEKYRAMQSESDRNAARLSRLEAQSLTATEASPPKTEKPAKDGPNPHSVGIRQALKAIDDLDRDQGFEGKLKAPMETMVQSIIAGLREQFDREYAEKFDNLQNQIKETDKYVKPSRQYEAAMKVASSYGEILDMAGHSPQDFAAQYAEVRQMLDEEGDKFPGWTDHDAASFTIRLLTQKKAESSPPPDEPKVSTEAPSASKGVRKTAPVPGQAARPNSPSPERKPAKTPAGDPYEDRSHRSSLNAKTLNDFFARR